MKALPLVPACAVLLAAAEPPSPSQFLGFTVGADRQLADYTQASAYFRALAKASPRVRLVELGTTTQGQPMLMAVVSSEANLKRLEHFKDIARQLADPRGLDRARIDALAKEGKAFLLLTCSLHSTEIGASQMALEWAHDLARTQDPALLKRLDEVILLLVPNLNPDGQNLVVDWYRKQLGTPFEGGRMPWLYHPYVGHDNNRDWWMLTQKETRAVNRAVYAEWFPQVWVDEHQMGSTGPRLFVPPYTNPVAANVHPLVWRTIDHIGGLMSWRLEEQGRPGVAYGAMFDAYWPGGSKNTAWWKNVVGILTEAASCRVATPVEIAPGELSGGTKGLAKYQPQINFPNPWKGGTWRLRDIMDYQRGAADAALEACATQREALLRDRARMALDGVALGSPDRLWRIPRTAPEQRDPHAGARLAHLLRENGAEVLAGSDAYYVPTAQPLHRFVKEMLEVQRYPEVRPAPGAPVLEPYDVSAWSLPLLLGARVEEVALDGARRGALHPLKDEDRPRGGLDRPDAARYALVRKGPADAAFLNAALKAGLRTRVAEAPIEARGRRYPAGTLVLEAARDLGALARAHGLALEALDGPPPKLADQAPVRVGLYKPWTASMDEGWTRWILEQAGFAPKGLDNAALRAGRLAEAIDVLVLPDLAKAVIQEGRIRREESEARPREDMPEPYTGGIGKEGAKAIRDFVEAGGTVVALASSCEYLIDELSLPVRNTLARAKPEEFGCPGALLHLDVDPTHPVTWGLPARTAAFLNQRIALQTSPSTPQVQRTVLATYPAEARDILASGWIRGAERLERASGAVALRVGKGKVVLLAFNAQFRAQTEATFPLLFNALHWAGLKGEQR